MSEQSKKAERRCGNCHHWQGEDGMIRAACEAPVPKAIRAITFGRRLMLSTGGTDCHAHRMKPVRASKAAVVQVGEGA